MALFFWKSASSLSRDLCQSCSFIDFYDKSMMTTHNNIILRATYVPDNICNNSSGVARLSRWAQWPHGDGSPQKGPEAEPWWGVEGFKSQLYINHLQTVRGVPAVSLQSLLTRSYPVPSHPQTFLIARVDPLWTKLGGHVSFTHATPLMIKITHLHLLSFFVIRHLLVLQCCPCQ